MGQVFIHPTAEVSAQATIGTGVRIWHHVQIRERVRIGRHCIIGKSVYVDFDVVIGDNVKIQNGCFLYHGSALEDGVFLGPGVILTNDKLPRAINPDGSLKTDSEWTVGEILIKRGASLGASVVVLPNVVIGEFAMIGAGSIVTKSVPDYGLAVGNPARLIGFVCPCGGRLREERVEGGEVKARCKLCEASVGVPIQGWREIA